MIDEVLKLNNFQHSYFWFRVFFFRGIIQCLKLSPNLRKQTKDVKTALMNKDPKKALELEVKKLEVLLAMVREPDENPSTLVREQEEI